MELNIDSIIKYGVCRLLIEISDSGKGLELEKINQILNISSEITEEEIEKIDNLKITLPIAHKMIKALDGNFIIKSEKGIGTNFLIVIDQKIEYKKSDTNKLENYSKKIVNQKKIMIVSDNTEIIKTTKEELGETEIITSIFPKECIEKMKTEKFACIIIDENLNEESGINIEKEIKKINPNQNVLGLISTQNEFIKKHYLEDGFDDIITKETYKKELDKIKKYL